METTAEHKLVIGYPDEWKQFRSRNKLFFEKFPLLKRALDLAFLRKATITTDADKAILFTGRLCIEDFMELFCLAGNGYGIGAMKLLRGLYERVVTVAYLADHPEEAHLFLDFRFVSRHKTLQAYIAAGTEDERWKRKAEEAKGRYERVMDKFRVPACKKCGTTRINHTWSTLDFVSMAKSTGDLGKLAAPAYYETLNHAHSTAEAIRSRLERQTDGGIGFQPGPQRDHADTALRIAHCLMVILLEAQAKHFKVEGLLEIAGKCAEDHVAIWSGRKMVVDPES